jgi:hypothetical protein
VFDHRLIRPNPSSQIEAVICILAGTLFELLESTESLRLLTGPFERLL